MSLANLDEFIPLLLWEKDVDREAIEALKGNLMGERGQDELITLRVRDYEVFWKAPGMLRLLAAWALYEAVNRAVNIEEKLHDIWVGKF